MNRHRAAAPEPPSAAAGAERGASPARARAAAAPAPERAAPPEPRPLPLAPCQLVGVGVDVVAAGRMRSLLRRVPAARDRLFSPREQQRCERFSDPYSRYAARFAAKEAVGKALGVGLIGYGWREVEVVDAPSGKPEVVLHGALARVAREGGVTRIELSLCHEEAAAYAVAAAMREAFSYE